MRNWKNDVASRLAEIPVDPIRRASIVDEVAAHLEDRYQALRAGGASPEEAERAVMAELRETDVLKRALERSERPGVNRAVPVTGEPSGHRWFDSLRQDARYGVRSLWRAPGFTSVALLTLALGVGANVALFTVVNTVMLRPLPYEEPDRLVLVSESNPARGWPVFAVSHPNFLDWRAQTRSFERLAAQTPVGFTLTSAAEAIIVRARAATSDLLPLLRIAPALGRNFQPEEDRPGGNTRVAVITHAFWQRHFGGDGAVLGSSLALDNVPYEVIGVLPASFATAWGGPELDLLVPLAANPARDRGDRRLLVVGRMKPGITIEQAQAEMQALAAQLALSFPASNDGWTVVMRSFYDWLVPAESREALLILMGAVALVLLVACGNIASLQLARASARQREFSVRAALGAQRSRIVSQWLVESMLLTVAAAALGLLVALATTRLVVASAPDAVPRLDELSIDTGVFAFAFAIALVAAVLVALGPAWYASSPQLAGYLKDGDRGGSSGRSRQRIRGALVIGEVALSVALLIGAGLLIRSFWQIQQVQPGFETDRLITMRLSLPRTSYDTSDKGRQFYARLLPAVAALPGIQAASVSSGPPLAGGNTSLSVSIPGRTFPADVPVSANWRLVWTGYFRTMGIPLRGRDFEPADALEGEGTRAVTIVSEAMVRRYWPGEDVLGKTVNLSSFGPAPRTIVGVAGDVRSFGLDEEPDPMVYAPAMEYAIWNPMHLVLRSAHDPPGHVAAVRAAVRSIDGSVPVYDVNLFDNLLSDSLGSRRFNMYLLACFASLALGLACVGLFGVLAYVVSQRSREIGVRLALGATRGDVFRLIVGQGLALAVAGAALGVAGGFGAARLLRSLLFSVAPNDPVTFIAVPVLLVIVALLACFGPAHRATRVDPLTALRAE